MCTGYNRKAVNKRFRNLPRNNSLELTGLQIKKRYPGKTN